jgi:hypothetical protein
MLTLNDRATQYRRIRRTSLGGAMPPLNGLLATVVALLALAASRSGGQPLVRGPSVKFDHVHLVHGDPDAFADYYYRLFVPGRTERGRFLGYAGVRDSTSMLLFAAGTNRRHGQDSVAWQMGWGEVRLDQSYRQHYLSEVNWRTPYETLGKGLHLHVLTSDAASAAGWYSEALGADVEVSRRPSTADNSEVRAIARLAGLTIAFHPTEEVIRASRDAGTIDHLAFTVSALDALDLPLTAQGRNDPYAPMARKSALVAGPDGLLIELIEEGR